MLHLKKQVYGLEKEKMEKMENKRITIIERTVLNKIGKRFKESTESEIFFNKTDLKINKELEELNKNKRSRFYSIKYDFKLTTKKGLNDFIIFLVNAGASYRLYDYNKLIDNLKNEIIGGGK